MLYVQRKKNATFFPLSSCKILKILWCECCLFFVILVKRYKAYANCFVFFGQASARDYCVRRSNATSTNFNLGKKTTQYNVLSVQRYNSCSESQTYCLHLPPFFENPHSYLKTFVPQALKHRPPLTQALTQFFPADSSRYLLPIC